MQKAVIFCDTLGLILQSLVTRVSVPMTILYRFESRNMTHCAEKRSVMQVSHVVNFRKNTDTCAFLVIAGFACSVVNTHQGSFIGAGLVNGYGRD